MWAQEALIMVEVPSFPLQSSAVLSSEHHPSTCTQSQQLVTTVDGVIDFPGKLPSHRAFTSSIRLRSCPVAPQYLEALGSAT